MDVLDSIGRSSLLLMFPHGAPHCPHPLSRRLLHDSPRPLRSASAPPTIAASAPFPWTNPSRRMVHRSLRWSPRGRTSLWSPWVVLSVLPQLPPLLGQLSSTASSCSLGTRFTSRVRHWAHTSLSLLPSLCWAYVCNLILITPAHFSSGYLQQQQADGTLSLPSTTDDLNVYLQFGAGWNASNPYQPVEVPVNLNSASGSFQAIVPVPPTTLMGMYSLQVMVSVGAMIF